MCTLCPETFKFGHGYHMHIVSDHFPMQSIPCPHCGKVFNHPTKLNYHISKYHVTGKKYGCKKCDEKFTTDSKRKQHLCNQRTYICNYCGKEYRQNHQLTKHVQHKHEKSEKKWICDLCGKEYENEDYMKEHKKLVHLAKIGKIIQERSSAMRILERVRSFLSHFMILTFFKVFPLN